jgi:cytidyltransferase-like protein
MNYQIPTHLKPLYPKVPYHNLAHTESFEWESCPSVEAFWAAVYHDFVYDPHAVNNEEASYNEFKKYVQSCIGPSKFTRFGNMEQVKKLIFSTKDHVKYFDPSDEDMVWLHKNDLACFRVGSDIVTNERNIFREYQHVNNLKFYKEKRMAVLRYYQSHPLISKVTIDTIVEYLSMWQPKYGIFCGSFNPFHIGHYDILQQAEKIFDKVIVAQGQNEDKPEPEYSLDNVLCLKYHETAKYTGSLFEFLKWQQKRLKDVTLIRGLRDANDLRDESVLFNFGKDLTTVPFAYFISKSENLHISSGAIRKLTALNIDTTAYVP